MTNWSSQRRYDRSRLMVLEESGIPQFTSFADIDRYLRPNDLLVMNLSATVPASLLVKRRGRQYEPEQHEPEMHHHEGAAFELRLAGYAGSSLGELRDWWAIPFGAGDWRLPTEERGDAPILKRGDILTAGDRLSLEVKEVDPLTPRLLRVSFLGEGFLPRLYQAASPIQYSYQDRLLHLWDVQTPLAQRPLSVEAPSALFPFRWERLLNLKKRFRVAYLYHGAGISSTGDAALDERLPLPEFYSIPEKTVMAWRETRAKAGRVIAVGTSVARALESARAIGEGALRSFEGVTTLRVREGCLMERVDGLLTGYHTPLTSHFELESAFVGGGRLRAAFAQAERRGFLPHEFGDASLLLSR